MSRARSSGRLRPETAFALAAAAHAGFQVTVSVLVYPALARTPPPLWPEVHRRHSASITPLVAAVYGGLALTGVRLLRARPSGSARVGVGAAAGAMALTAGVAAPLHGRLGGPGDQPAPVLLRRLVRADRGRAALAVVSAVAAAGAARAYAA